MPRKDDEEETEESPDEDEERAERRDSALLLLRDIVIAVVLVFIVLGAIYAYAQVWPPMVVVESGSMQHGSEGHIGAIDTGDLVLVQAVHDVTDVTTYVQGRASGYQTYGNYGDVIVFYRPGEATPVIHRAMVYVIYPTASTTQTGGVDVPSLNLIPGAWSGTLWDNRTTTTTPIGLRSFSIYGVATWDSPTGREVDRQIDFGVATLRTSGFLTKGDHNPTWDAGHPPAAMASLIGKARGELPWFGLLKLIIAPGTCCPSGWGDPTAPKNSWDSLALTLVLIPIGLYLVDYTYGFAEDAWAWRRRKRERESESEDEEEADE